MPTLTQHVVETLSEFTGLVEAMRSGSTCVLWYRGCRDGSYPLVPTLYRHPDAAGIAELLELEKQLMVRFRQRSVPYHTRELKESWESLFFMQHFGVPTRLLDWTESPYIGLYFALADAEPGADAAVWALRPCEWNRHALGYMSHSGDILTPDDGALLGYRPASDPGFDLNTMNEDPVAVFGTHNSPRIVAQRGVFTVFGKSTTPMETVYVDKNFPQDSLVKLVIPAAGVCALLSAVLSIGVTDSTVFPDLDGVAREMRRMFRFKV